MLLLLGFSLSLSLFLFAVTADIKQEFGTVFDDKQLTEFLGQFKKFDLDNSGGIDLEELRQVHWLLRQWRMKDSGG